MDRQWFCLGSAVAPTAGGCTVFAGSKRASTSSAVYHTTSLSNATVASIPLVIWRTPPMLPVSFRAPAPPLALAPGTSWLPDVSHGLIEPVLDFA